VGRLGSGMAGSPLAMADSGLKKSRDNLWYSQYYDQHFHLVGSYSQDATQNM